MIWILGIGDWDDVDLVLDGAWNGGLGCVGGTLALLVGETGRHVGDRLVLLVVV
jgi:hypothetical protein